MLSGEGNARERWKTTIGLISKKATLHVQHTFLYISLPLFYTTTTWSVQKLLNYSVFLEKMSHVFSIICKNRSGINQGFVVSCCRASYFNSSKQEMKNTNKRVYDGVSDVGCESFDFLSNDNGDCKEIWPLKSVPVFTDTLF